MTWQKAAAIAAVVGLLIVISTLFFKYHARFASADQVQKVATEFTYYRLSNEAAALQSRMWQLEDRYQCEVKDMPQTPKEEYRRLEVQRNALLLKVQSLDSKK
jgi:hypothetical protein